MDLNNAVSLNALSLDDWPEIFNEAAEISVNKGVAKVMQGAMEKLPKNTTQATTKRAWTTSA